MLTFFVEDRASFAECRRLLSNARKYVPDVPVVCCGVAGMELCVGGDGAGDGTAPHTRAVTEAEARTMCAKLGMEYCEVDARAAADGRVEAAFNTLVRRMMARTTQFLAQNNNTRRR